MQNYYSQRLEMQIPKGNVYSPVTTVPDFDEKFKRLSKNYNIHQIRQVKEFIKNNAELIDYINRITPIINEFYPKHVKCITFCKDYEFEELTDITIYIKSTDNSFDEDCEKFDELEIEIINLNDYTTDIKKLVSMDLWLL